MIRRSCYYSPKCPLGLLKTRSSKLDVLNCQAKDRIMPCMHMLEVEYHQRFSFKLSRLFKS